MVHPRSPLKPEHRWPAAVAILLALFVYLFLPPLAPWMPSWLFPGVALNSSLSLYVTASEGPGYSGTKLDPDGDNGIGIIGYYGQAVGPFGAGQSLRAGAFFAD